MPNIILDIIERLVLLDLTDRNNVINFQRALVEEGRELFNYHAVNHNEHCDCREYQRTLALFNVILNYLYQLIRNNSF